MMMMVVHTGAFNIDLIWLTHTCQSKYQNYISNLEKAIFVYICIIFLPSLVKIAFDSERKPYLD